MPINNDELNYIIETLTRMFDSTIKTFESIREHSEFYFTENNLLVNSAIEEYLKDFNSDKEATYGVLPKKAIQEATIEQLHLAGFYGKQLELKQLQVFKINKELMAVLPVGSMKLFKSTFKKFVNIINNFLGSLEMLGFGTALKELKDCLRDELPD